MNCFKHIETAAVAPCNGCQRGLCPGCQALFRPPLCADCAQSEAGRQSRALCVSYVPSVIGAVVGFMFAQHIDASSAHKAGAIPYIVFTYYGASVPSGWRILNAITPKMFLFMSIGAWVTYFIFKGALSALVGFVALPIRLALDIRKFMQSRQLSVTASAAQ